MRDALWAELLKVRRSRLPWLTALAFTIAATMCGLFMFVLQDLERARALGLLGGKAQLSGATPDWPGYFALLAQATGVGGLLIFGMIAIWLFGREFSDRTAKDLLALPTSRTSIVVAKFAVAAAWTLLLAAQIVVLGLLIGTALDLPAWSIKAVFSGIGLVISTAVLTYLLTTPFALAASIGRGYLAAVAVMFAALFCAQVIAALGYGHYFPYSVPGLRTGLAGTGQQPGTLGYLSVAAVGITGITATTAWWRNADHNR